jgi:hypothetical protein
MINRFFSCSVRFESHRTSYKNLQEISQLLLAAATPLCQTTPTKHPNAPVENGCVFSAARERLGAVCQLEVLGGASWIVHGHGFAGH